MVSFISGTSPDGVHCIRGRGTHGDDTMGAGRRVRAQCENRAGERERRERTAWGMKAGDMFPSDGRGKISSQGNS